MCIMPQNCFRILPCVDTALLHNLTATGDFCTRAARRDLADFDWTPDKEKEVFQFPSAVYINIYTKVDPGFILMLGLYVCTTLYKQDNLEMEWGRLSLV